MSCHGTEAKGGQWQGQRERERERKIARRRVHASDVINCLRNRRVEFLPEGGREGGRWRGSRRAKRLGLGSSEASRGGRTREDKDSFKGQDSEG